MMVRNKLHIISLLLMLLLAMVSCERKALVDACMCTDRVAVPICIDWSKSGITPQNVSVLAYNVADGTLAHEHRYEHSGSEIQSYLYLPIGEYNVVIFNELRDQIDYVRCSGYENFWTLKFYATAAQPMRTRAETRVYVNQPGDLAVKVIEGVKVTKELILENQTKGTTAQYYKTRVKTRANEADEKEDGMNEVTNQSIIKLIDVVPVRKTSVLKITTHVKGLNNARMPALADLNNLSGAYMVATDKNDTHPVSHQFTMNNRTYDPGSTTDGTISAVITTFGVLGNRLSLIEQKTILPIKLNTLFMLTDEDKTEVAREEDVTDDVKIVRNTDMHTVLDINAHINEALPEVIAEEGSGSGFGTQLEDWDVVDVPLVAE